LPAQPEQNRSHVFGVVGNGDRLGAPAALAEPALVVTHDDESGRDQIARELPEHRDAGHHLVAIGRPRAADQDDSRQHAG
jgi:hypothetical protein